MYIGIGLGDGLQILVQTLAEVPDADVIEKAYRYNDTCQQVEPTIVERTLVGFGGKYRVIVHQVEQWAILTVRKFFNQGFQLVADACNLVIVSMVGEHFVIIGDGAQLMLAQISLTLLAHFVQIGYYACIVRVFDNNFFLEDVA